MIDLLLNPCRRKDPQINQILIVPIRENHRLDMPDFQGNNGHKRTVFIELLFIFVKARKILDFLARYRDLNPIGSTSNCQIESSRFWNPCIFSAANWSGLFLGLLTTFWKITRLENENVERCHFVCWKCAIWGEIMGRESWSARYAVFTRIHESTFAFSPKRQGNLGFPRHTPRFQSNRITIKLSKAKSIEPFNCTLNRICRLLLIELHCLLDLPEACSTSFWDNDPVACTLCLSCPKTLRVTLPRSAGSKF
jgi:hypothetical protein